MRFINPLVIFIFCILSFSAKIVAQQETSSRLIISAAEVKRISEDRPVFSFWISATEEMADSVKVSVPYIISAEGERLKIDHKIDPESINIPPGKVGHLFNISFNSSQIGKLETGIYTAIIIATSTNHTELKENLSFEIKASVSAISFLNEKASWIKENIFSLLFSFLEIIGVALIVIILIRVFRNLLGGKKALRILPIVDETGKGSEYGGIASGIDDLLQCKIQDILGLINDSIVSRSALSGIKTQDESGIRGQSSRLNILKGSEDIDPQKIGDLGVGIFKIPLGSLITVISKMFGGTYVTGALQKYSSTNKLILTLEQRTFLSLKKKSVVLFEGSWESKDLADGIQDIIEELSYRLIIHLSEDINTSNWKAYMHFLQGNVHFSEYEKNNSRIDLLRDAISCWRESVRIDPKFAETHYNLGVALDRDNQISDALFRYNKAVEFGTLQTKVRALTNIARIYIQDIKSYEIARELIDKAKKLNSSFAELWNLEGLIFLNEQKDTEASFCFQQAIKFNQNEVNKNRNKEEPVYHYNLSVANYYLKNYAVSESAGITAYNLYPEDHKPGYLLQTLGLLFNKKTEYDNALIYFEEGLQKEPENRDMLDGYSTTLYNLRRYDESLAVHKRLLRLYPEYSNGYSNFVRMLELNGYADNIKSLFGNLGTLLLSTDYNSTLKKLQDNFESYNAGSIEKNIYAAVLGGIYTYVYKNYVSASDYFKIIAANENPTFENLFLAETFLTYGVVLNHIEKFEEATTYLTRAISLFSQHQIYDLAFCFETLARAYSELKKPNDADAAISNAISNYKKINMIKKVSDLYSNRASWLIGINYYKAAEDDCNQAIYFDRTNYQAYHNKGTILYNYLKEEDAIPQYEHSVEIYFDVPGTHYTIGLCHYYLGNYVEAINKFETAIKLKKDYASPEDMNGPDPYQRLALTWEISGNPGKAEEILKKAVNLFPQKVKYRLLLARIYKKLRRYSEAERELNYALTLYESGPQPFKHLVHNELADIYLDFGIDYNAAFNHINEAIKILEDKKELTQSDKDDLKMLNTTLGWTYFRQKKYEEAKEVLDNILSSLIGDVKTHSRVALLYQQMSETEKDELLKSDYKNTAIDQWKIVKELSSEENIRKNAEEQLAKLLK
jgi:tetratricopeptide (TPR) repeat protein